MKPISIAASSIAQLVRASCASVNTSAIFWSRAGSRPLFPCWYGPTVHNIQCCFLLFFSLSFFIVYIHVSVYILKDIYLDFMNIFSHYFNDFRQAWVIIAWFECCTKTRCPRTKLASIVFHSCTEYIAINIIRWFVCIWKDMLCYRTSACTDFVIYDTCPWWLLPKRNKRKRLHNL